MKVAKDLGMGIDWKLTHPTKTIFKLILTETIIETHNFSLRSYYLILIKFNFNIEKCVE